MSLTFYHNLKDALGTLKKGEALCTNSYLALFPLTIVYKRNNPHDKYIGQRLLTTSRISDPDLSGDDLISSISFISFYLLSILRSDDLLSEVGDLILALERNKNVFTSYFIDFALSGLREIKSLGGEYLGIGTCYHHLGVREEDSYEKYSKLMELIRESVLFSLSGLDLDLRDLDYSPLEDRINEYLSSVASDITSLSLHTEIEFIDRRLVGTSGRLVASEWFNRRGLRLLDHEGYDHLTRALSDGVKSLYPSVSYKDLKEIVPDFVGHLLVNLSFPNPRGFGGGHSPTPGGFVAVPIRHRPAEITKSSKTLEVDYLVFFKSVVDHYEFEYSVTRGLSSDVPYSSRYYSYLSSIIGLVYRASDEVSRESLLLEEYPENEPSTSTEGEVGETSGKSVVVDYISRLSLSVENNSRFLSSYYDKPLERLNPPDLFVVGNDLFSIRQIYYDAVTSKRYILSFDSDSDSVFGLKLKELPRSERLASPENEPPTLRADFFVGNKVYLDVVSKSISNDDLVKYNLDPSFLGKDLIEKAYKQVNLVHSLVLDNKPELSKKLSSRVVYYFISVLEMLRRAFKNFDSSTGGFPGATFSYNENISSVSLILRNPVLVLNPPPPISLDEEVKTFDSEALRYLLKLKDIFSRGGDLCARVGNDTLKLYFWKDLGDREMYEVYVANLFGEYLERIHRSEVETHYHYSGSLKRVEQRIEDFSWRLSSLVFSSLMVFEKDHRLELGIPLVDRYVPYLVNELVAKLTENRERDYIHPERRSSSESGKRLPILVRENFAKSVESILIKIEDSATYKIYFSVDKDGKKNISAIPFLGGAYYTELANVQAFYLPSGVRGKRLKLVVG